MCDGMKTVVQEHGEEDEHARDRISNAHSPRPSVVGQSRQSDLLLSPLAHSARPRTRRPSVTGFDNRAALWTSLGREGKKKGAFLCISERARREK